jgi:hypothetical protein
MCPMVPGAHNLRKKSYSWKKKLCCLRIQLQLHLATGLRHNMAQLVFPSFFSRLLNFLWDFSKSVRWVRNVFVTSVSGPHEVMVALWLPELSLTVFLGQRFSGEHCVCLRLFIYWFISWHFFSFDGRERVFECSFVQVLRHWVIWALWLG